MGPEDKAEIAGGKRTESRRDGTQVLTHTLQRCDKAFVSIGGFSR
jgi:hypothetical protein